MHGNIIAQSPAQVPLDQLGAEIVARIKAATRLREKRLDHLTAAGLRLIEARERAPDFATFLKEHCPDVKRSQAYHLMRLAGCKTTVDAERAKIAERVRKHRAAKDRPLRNGQSSEATTAKRTTALDLIELWKQMPATEDRQVFEAIGLRRVLAGLPESWLVSLKTWVDERRSLPPPAKVDLKSEHQIPNDLSIPDFLRRVSTT